MEMLGLAGILVFLITVLLILQFVRLQNAATSLPPGPTPLPILGNLWTLNFTLHHGTLMQLAKKYGNTFTVWAGHSPIVVFNGYQAVRDMLVSNSEATSGRPMTPALRSYSKERGVIMVNGHIWKQHRRFIAATLRHMLLGKNSLQLQIQEEAKLLLEEFTSHGGRPVDPCQLIEVSVANVISFLVFGQRVPSNNGSSMRLTKFTSTISHFLNSQISQLYNAFPWLMNHLPGPQQRYFAQMENFYKYARRQIKHHQATNNVEPHTLVDFYMTEISKTKDDPESTFDEDNMIQVVTDFFVAGTHTTVETLLWALLYLVAQPDIQEKVHSELDGVLEPSHTIQYDDHKRLPYTNAVLHEVLRLSSILPTSLPHLCLKNTTIQGFPIQKGTVLLANLISVNLDPKHWENPDQFNPHHFLDKDGQFVKKEAFLPFSAGYRTCVGDQLAKVQLFQFFSNLLRQFSFKLPDGIKEVDFEPVCDLTLRPKTYQICAVSRDCAHG